MVSYTYNLLREELARDEGCKLSAYTDSEGFLTIGYGRLIDARKGGKISQAEASILLSNDIAACEQDLDRNIPWWRTISDARQRALLNLCINLGIAGLLRFRKMLDAAMMGDWNEAATECLNSDAGRKLPNRYGRIAQMIREGE